MQNSAWKNLRIAAIKLRKAQKAYMKDRGNDALGKQVGKSALEVDAALAELEAVEPMTTDCTDDDAKVKYERA